MARVISARMVSKSGGVFSSMVTTTRRGTGNSSMLSPLPSHGSSKRAVASLSMMLVSFTPAKPRAMPLASCSALSISSPSTGRIWMVASRAIWLCHCAAEARTKVTPPRVRQARNVMIAITITSAVPVTLPSGTIGLGPCRFLRLPMRTISISLRSSKRMYRSSMTFRRALCQSLSASIIDVEPPMFEDHAPCIDLVHQGKIMRRNDDSGA